LSRIKCHLNLLILVRSADDLEYMRHSRFVRMHRNGNFMSLDDFCKKHNYTMKQCMNHAAMEVMIGKSRHLHAGSRVMDYFPG
jgi:hypothetical protein